jgi:ATP-dependent Zn protease
VPRTTTSLGQTTAALARPALALILAVSLALSGLAGGVALAAEGTIVYTHESEADFAKQLAAKQVKSVEVNKRLRTMRVTLADGSHVLARYPKKQEPQTVARLEGHHVAVTVLSKHAAEKEAGPKKPAHHKIRYIVGGVVVLVIVIVVAVLAVNRRRRRD